MNNEFGWHSQILGPTFIKLGQILASRPDLVGPSLSEELKQLRANVAPDRTDQVRETLRSELGEDYESHFQTIDFDPLATASIGQVHRAVLNDGSRVVLKVQRSGIEEKMQQDMEVLAGIAQLAERVDALNVWGPGEMVRQLAPMITRELDFTRERQNLDQFAEMFHRKNCAVTIPRPVNALCTRRVLVMDELIGDPLPEYLENHPDLNARSNHQTTETAEQPSANGCDRYQPSTPHGVFPNGLRLDQATTGGNDRRSIFDDAIRRSPIPC